jgi:RNA polymerase sigma factor (sigma-70 family)
MEAGALPRPGRGLAPRSRRLLAAFSDDRLVEQLRRGNDAAFAVIYDRHSRGILSFCRHMLGTLEEAEDAVQHTFLAAYNDLLASDRPIKLKAWLYTIARNRCLSMLRARREHPVEEIEVSTAGLADQVQERQDLRELLADIRQLPDEQRAALVLAELGDLSHTDIGDVLGVDPMKVKSLVFQARSTLIEYRDARSTPCVEIREQLSTLRGGALRRGPLRKHLSTCDGCRAFRDDVRRQRAMMAAVLPVIPSVGLKNSALAAVGVGGGGAGAAAAGGAATAGGIFSGLGSASIVAKTVVALAVGGAAVGGGVAIEKTASGPNSSSPPASVEQGTTHRSSVAADHAQGPPGTSVVTSHGAAGTAPHGLARRVRAHGSPATKHHGNPNASTHGHVNATTPHGHSNTGVHGNAGTNGGGKGSSGTKTDHAAPQGQGHQTSGTKRTGGKGHQTTTAPTTTDTTSTPTTSTTPPVLHGNANSVRTPKPPKDPTATAPSAPTLP